MPKLYRVEVERTETAVVYVIAERAPQASVLAVKVAADLGRADWDPDGGIRANSEQDMTAFTSRDLSSDDEADYMVSGDPEGRTVGEWLQANGGEK